MGGQLKRLAIAIGRIRMDADDVIQTPCAAERCAIDEYAVGG